MQKHSLGDTTAHGAWAIQSGIQTRQCTGQETYHVACSVSGYPEAVSWATKQQDWLEIWYLPSHCSQLSQPIPNLFCKIFSWMDAYAPIVVSQKYSFFWNTAKRQKKSYNIEQLQIWNLY